MSLLVFGAEEDIRKVGHFVFHYDDIVQRNGELPTSVESIEVCTPHAWSMTNKYYSADLQLVFHSLVRGDVDPSAFEGVILVRNEEAEAPVRELGNQLADVDLPLKLLVTFKRNGSPQDDSVEEENLLWCVDRGFEWIEICERNLVEGHDERDKSGLPRLMEALQSTMWSTLKKISADKHTKPVKITEEEELPAVPAIPSSAVAPPAAKEDEDDEDDFEVFAQMMAQARTMRDDALSGKLSDEQRRRNAADFAMMMSQMLDLNDEEEDDE